MPFTVMLTRAITSSFLDVGQSVHHSPLRDVGVTVGGSEGKPLGTSTLASLAAQLVKNLPAMWETWVQSLGWKKKKKKSLGWEDPLERENATHSSILAWKIP